ncbi:MAG: NUDIX domain-containing protein, partial [Candidatus Limnocylindria bacterium]
MGLARVAKVLCVIRDGQLLVFRHRDYPEAGVQVPAGTLHEDEDPAVGALRETEEETGRSGRIVRTLGRFDHEFRDRFAGVERHEIHVCHAFLVEPPPGLPERWSHLAEIGDGLPLMRRAISKDFEALEWEPVTGAWNRASRLRAQFSGRSSKRLADRDVKDTPCSPRTRRSVDLLRSPPDHDPDDPKRTRSILC